MAGFGPKQILAFDVSPSEQLAKEARDTIAIDSFSIYLSSGQVSLLRYVSLEEVASSCDVISLHVPLLPSTHHLVAAALLAKMRPHAVLVNTSRGALVHTHDLLAALKAGKLAGIFFFFFCQSILNCLFRILRRRVRERAGAVLCGSVGRAAGR
jgi:lactate dehydrogenase-like 2-hydroxyacid dehydrogenase